VALLRPGVLHSQVVYDTLKDIIADLNQEKHWPAYEKLRHLVDSLVPFCYTLENDEPILPADGHLKVQTELEDAEDLEKWQQGGRCRGKIDLAELVQDLEKIFYRMEKNKYGAVKEDLEQILAELATPGLAGSKYRDFGRLGDVILVARSEVKKVRYVIGTGDICTEVVPATECVKLLEKFIDEAYDLGQQEAAVQNSK